MEDLKITKALSYKFLLKIENEQICFSACLERGL